MVVVVGFDSTGGLAAEGSGVVVGDNDMATNGHVIDGVAAIAVRLPIESRSET